MRVLILSWRDIKHPRKGGSEVWLHTVAEGLVSLGHSVTIFAASVKEAPRSELLAGVEVIRGGNALTVYAAARKFCQSNTDKFDVVLEVVNTRPFFSSRWGETPSVYMIHQVAKDVWKYEAPALVALLGRYVLEPMWLRRLRGESVLTLSPSSRDSLKEYGIVNARVVLPGGDCSSVSFTAKEPDPTMVFLGRMVDSKRPEEVLEAFAAVKLRCPTAQLWMIGDGPRREKLMRSSVDGVTFFGRVSHEERQQLLSRAHILVATSVREGWGLNVSEAACVGTPTIGYGSPGLVDSIRLCGGKTVDQSVNALADAVVDFFQGHLRLTPKIGTQSWDAAVTEIEAALIAKLMNFLP